MWRFIKIGALGLLVAVLALYLGDAVVFAVRKSHGNGYRLIVVNQFLATPLKGQKVEYDAADSVNVTCSRTIFPQPGTPACWWVERHTTQWQ